MAEEIDLTIEANRREYELREIRALKRRIAGLLLSESVSQSDINYYIRKIQELQ